MTRLKRNFRYDFGLGEKKPGREEENLHLALEQDGICQPLISAHLNVE